MKVFTANLFKEVFYLSIYLSIYLPTYLPIYLSIYLFIYLSTYLPTYLPIFLSTYLSFYLPTYLPTYLPYYLPTYLPICLSVYLPIYLSINLSIYLPTYLPTYLSIYHSIYLPTYLPTLLPTYLSLCLSTYLSIHQPAFLSICVYPHTHFSPLYNIYSVYCDISCAIWATVLCSSLQSPLPIKPLFHNPFHVLSTNLLLRSPLGSVPHFLSIFWTHLVRRTPSRRLPNSAGPLFSDSSCISFELYMQEVPGSSLVRLSAGVFSRLTVGGEWYKQKIG